MLDKGYNNPPRLSLSLVSARRAEQSFATTSINCVPRYGFSLT